MVAGVMSIGEGERGITHSPDTLLKRRAFLSLPDPSSSQHDTVLLLCTPTPIIHFFTIPLSVCCCELQETAHK
jgi:hypothetical protein